MSWVGKFFQNRGWLGITQYNSTTGLFYVNGTAVTGVSSYTWAQFTDAGFDLTVARHVVVTDKHSSTNGFGGSLWYVDPTATSGNKRQLRSAPIRATWATRLDAATYPGLRHYFTDIGIDGSIWYSNGTRYKIYGSGSCVLKIDADIAIASSTTEVITTSVSIPTDGTKSCFQNGDRIRFFSQVSKTGTANQLAKQIRMGSVNTTGAASLYNATPSAANIVMSDRTEIRRMSATSVRMVGQINNSYQLVGGSAVALVNDKTGLDNIDTSATYYLNFGLALFGGTADTAVTHNDMFCELVTCGA